MSSDAQPDAPPPLRPSVFLSYASADRAAARALRDTLTAAGLEVWLDEDELGGGEAWDAKIRNQIRSCTYFMPVISATTEVRREGYFRREWRFAVERTLDLADDVLFLVPVVIDDTRDAGARVPEKFFSVQWLRTPGGQATPALRDLAHKLARGEAVAVESTATLAPPTTAGKKSRKERRESEPPPPFPKFPAFPEPGHRLRFCYDLVLWFGHLIHALWRHLPKFIRVLAAIVIIFNLISWIFRDHSPAAIERKAKKAEGITEAAKALGAAGQPGDSAGKDVGSTIASLVSAAAEGLQSGRPLALVTFSGDDEKYADHAFAKVIDLLPPMGESTITGLSPLPLKADATDADSLDRGTRLQSKFVLTGQVRTAAAGQTPQFTAKLYDVKQRTLIWTETYDTAQVDFETAAQRVVAAVKSRVTAAPESKQP
jgi:hypothetical protein